MQRHTYDPPLPGLGEGCGTCGKGESHPSHIGTRIGERPLDADVNPVGTTRAGHVHARVTGKRMKLGTKRHQAYEFIRRCANGATAEEVGKHFGWQHQSYSAACSTLLADGWIKQQVVLAEPQFRNTTSGNRAAVYVIDAEVEA